ncbi:T22D2 protein, partial [Polyodon spathula]|nr:T22D2 protein [Polyodon spathula]
MPAKKKSCFQITSVTQAQVAASSITDDTESLDDPDESRTEDVSSEIFDVSRATDLEPEEVCERSSSEETLNNVGETEASAHSAVPNVNPQVLGLGVTSRFRVIKLDHGTGEPFRRGRWTCMEFYERDSEGSVITRTVDSMRHATTSEHSTDRDSGLGATGGSVVGPAPHSMQGPDSTADSSFAAVSHLQQADQSSQPSQQQGYVQQAVMPVPSRHQQVQNPPSVPPVSQPQQFAYPVQPQQLPPAHLLPSQPSALPSSQPDYRQHLHLQSAPGSTAQTLLVSSLPVGQSVSQGPSPVMTPAASGAQVLGLPVQTGESAEQGTGVMQGTVPGVVQLQQQAMSQQQAPGEGGSNQLSGLHPGVLGVQNVPAVVPTTGILSGSTSVPGVSSNPVTMPNVPPTIGQSNMMSQSQASRVANLAQTAGSGVQGLPSVASNLPQSNFSQFQAQTQSVVSQVDENRRNSDVLPQPPVISGKDLIKPFIPEPLHLSAATPMNSITTTVFGIPITIDGDEDRNPSTAFYQAFPCNKLRNSKKARNRMLSSPGLSPRYSRGLTHYRGRCSTSGASVVAIDNKIEQAMDLVKSHLMYAVREEVEVLKEQIKELYERNSVLERENALLKSLANNDQLSQLPVQLTNPSSTSPPQQQLTAAPAEGGSQPTQLPQQPNVSSA